MAKQQKVTKLLAPVVPLKLSVEGIENSLEIELAWTMKGVLILEKELRQQQSININILQTPSEFWSEMSCATLGLGIWAMSQQSSQEYADAQGLEIILSYLTPDNYVQAMNALKECYIESLSKEKREAIRRAEKEAAEALAAEPKSETQDPTPAPAQV